MAAGIIYQTVTTKTGEEVELAFWVDETSSPTTWIPVTTLVNSSGSPIATSNPLATQLRTSGGNEISLPDLVDGRSPVASLPVSSGGYLINRNFDVDESEDNVSTDPCQVYRLRITNNATSSRFVKLYNETAANVTVGTTTPKDTITVPPASAAGNPTIMVVEYPHGLPFDTAMCIAATTAITDNDTGAPSANDVAVITLYTPEP